MGSNWQKSASDPRFQILGQAASEPRVPDWVHDDATLRALGPEFAEGADLPPDAYSRRQFLQVIGASAALAGAGGCMNQPQETIVPYVRAPEQIVPGRPLYYATATTHGGASLGLLVETHMGRPTKVEGNPLHPSVPEVMARANEEAEDDRVRFGATDTFSQAIILSLYDVRRSQTVLRNGQIDTWESMFTALRRQMERFAASGGRGLRLLTETVVSPTLRSQLERLLESYPEARWHQYEPINDDNALAGARLAFGEDVSALYRGRPQVVVSLDDDCLSDGPMHLEQARNIRWLDLNAPESKMSRLYVVETSSTLTGAAADHRLPVGPRGVLAFAASLARALGLEIGEVPATDEVPQEWLEAVVEDLRANQGRSVVTAGRAQPPVVHAIAHWLNATLGNVGSTVEYVAPADAGRALALDSIRELAAAMEAGEVEGLVMLSGNPAYDAPADVQFAKLLAKVPFTLHLSQYVDETSALSSWHIPEAHPFESWSDTRALDGTASIVQPLIAPLYEGKSAHQLLGALGGDPNVSGYDVVRAYWQEQLGAGEGSDFERTWKIALHDGIVPETRAETVTPSVAEGLAESIGQQLGSAPSDAAGAPVIAFRADPSVWDGRFAPNSWLQELPRPLTKLTWDNAALMGPRAADRLGLKTGDIAEIETDLGRIAAPVFVVPGHPSQTVTLHLGYGREGVSPVCDGVGVDVYPLRGTQGMWFSAAKAIRATGERHSFATTQHHHHMEGRDLVRAGTLEEYLKSPEHPEFVASHGHAPMDLSLYPEPEYDGYKWGMVVNQSACFGCNACVVACQAENNVPVVGKDQVERAREMHWLRIDNYYVGDPANPTVYHQPVMCMHCEYAPCEPVCPVHATTHSDEGLNEMTYNRCIGTRYCSNNCPYKVRRFNFYDFNADLRSDPLLQMLPNPDVTVRSRGVMEKCTYCVQRINMARITADKEGRSIRDGELVTACQAACPTQALTFGDLNDEQSAVRELSESSLNYSLLGELNTRPRTTYLAALRNPNPALADFRLGES